MKLNELLEIVSDRNVVGIYYRDRRDNLIEVGCYDGKNSIDEKYNYCDVISLAVDFDEGKICIDVIIDYLVNRLERVRFKIPTDYVELEETFDFLFEESESEDEITERINDAYFRWVQKKLDALQNEAFSETIMSEEYGV